MDQIKIGAFLKELRKEQNLTQEQFAEQLGVSSRTVSRWETGNNMPDISLLTEIAEFYDVSIPELINGERKSENMNEEIKEVAGKMADYAGAEKTTIIKNIRNHSMIGVCALVILIILELAVPEGGGVLADKLHLYCETLVYVEVIMICLISTGLLHKFERKQREINLPKPIWVLLAAAIAMIAIALKYYISRFF